MDHKILIQKFEHCRINGKNLPLFKNYLTNRKQYIQNDNNNIYNSIKNKNIDNNKKIINSNFEQT